MLYLTILRPIYCQPKLQYVGKDGTSVDYPLNARIRKEELPFIKIISSDPDMSVYEHTIYYDFGCMDCEIITSGDTIDENVITRIIERYIGRNIYISVKLKDKEGNIVRPQGIVFTVY